MENEKYYDSWGAPSYGKPHITKEEWMMMHAQTEREKNNIPDDIFLQYHGDGEPDSDVKPSDSDVTWSRERVYKDDIRYVRAIMDEMEVGDLAEAMWKNPIVHAMLQRGVTKDEIILKLVERIGELTEELMKKESLLPIKIEIPEGTTVEDF